MLVVGQLVHHGYHNIGPEILCHFLRSPQLRLPNRVQRIDPDGPSPCPGAGEPMGDEPDGLIPAWQQLRILLGREPHHHQLLPWIPLQHPV